MENTSGTSGRPRKHAPDIKRHNVTVVMTAPMRDAIREAAAATARSVSSEIDFRLGMSLELDKESGGAEIRRLTDFVRLTAGRLQERFGGKWTENAEVAVALDHAVSRYITGNSPDLPTAEQERRARDKLSDWADSIIQLNEEPGISEDEYSKRAADLLRLHPKLLKDLRAADQNRRDVRKKGFLASSTLLSIFRINEADKQ